MSQSSDERPQSERTGLRYDEQLRRLAAASLAINSEQSLDRILQVIVDQSRAVIGANQSVASLTLNPQLKQSINAVSLSEKYAAWMSFRVEPDGSGITAIVCEANRPFRMTQDELVRHPRWRNFGKYSKEHPPMRGWLAAPFCGRDGRNLGVLQLSDKYEGEFSEEDEWILVQLAQLASVAVENVGYYSDIREAQRKLRRQFEFTSAVTNSLAEGVCALDAEGRVTFLNPAAATMLGRTVEEVVGRPISEVVDSPHMADSLLSGPTAVADSRNERQGIFAGKDGVRFPVAYSVAPFVADGQPEGVVVTFRDVTERNRMEEQLRQSQRMEALGRVAGGVSHDFNNLLSGIIGFADLAILQLKPGDAARGYVQEVRKAGERAASLTAQLLAFSRKQVLQTSIIDLNEVVTEFERMLRRLIGENIEFSTNLSPGLGRLKADAGQLQQVIMNLVVNGCDAMPQGGKLTIETQNAWVDEELARTHLGLQTGPYVVLSVSDTGCGMSDEVQSRLFEPFFTTKIGKGTGLGLATVFGIVQQSGGAVAVSSRVGNGTTFRVYLPRNDEPHADAESGPAPRARERGSETILVAEDEPVVRNLAHEILSHAGYTVLPVADGAAAVDACRSFAGRIHLLLTDVVMPGMNGRELAERMLSMRPGIRVLFMSGYAVEADGDVLEPGAPFLQKPFTPDVLAGRVRAVLDSRESGQAGPPSRDSGRAAGKRRKRPTNP